MSRRKGMAWAAGIVAALLAASQPAWAQHPAPSAESAAYPPLSTPPITPFPQSPVRSLKEELIATLLEAFRNEKDAQTMIPMAEALVRHGLEDSKAVEELIRALRNGDERFGVTYQALSNAIDAGLEAPRTRMLVKGLIVALKSDDCALRASAASLLAKIDPNGL